VLYIVTACHVTAQVNQYSNYALDLQVTDFRNLAEISTELDSAYFIRQALKPMCNSWMLGKDFPESVVYCPLVHGVAAYAFFQSVWW